MLYRILKWLAKGLLWRLFSIEVDGLERIPPQSAAILAANHVSWLDALVVAVLADRPVYMIAKEELFRIPVVSFVLRRSYVMDARRDGSDHVVLRKALQALKEGHLVGLFPEGTRSRTGQLQEGRGGVALLALHSGAPVIPVAFQGTEQVYERWWLWHRHPVHVAVGEPVYLGSHRGRLARQQLTEASGKIMGAISSLLEVM